MPIVAMPAASAEAVPGRGGVVVLVVNYLSVDDLAAGPNMIGLLENSSVALMNTGLGERAHPDARYLTLNTGSRAANPHGRVICANASDRVGDSVAGDLYLFQTGNSAAAESVVCLGFARLARPNISRFSGVRQVGLLGDAFHSAGLRTAVVGNADIPGRPQRRAAFIAMDGGGRVDVGEVGEGAVRTDPLSPAGLSDDPTAAADLTARYMAEHALVVVELGDLSRLESMRSRLMDNAYRAYRTRRLAALDSYIGEIKPEIDRRDFTLVFCSPCRARADSGRGSNLSPVLVYRRGGSPGLLTSATTRMDGLISNMDVAPTILQAVGLSVPPHVMGRPAVTCPAGDALDHLREMERVAVRNYNLRIPVLAAIAAFAILVTSASELLIRSGRAHRKWRATLSTGLLVLMAMPAALLLVDGSGTVGAGRYVFALGTAALLIAGLSYLLAGRVGKGKISPPAFVYTLTVGLILLDVSTGTHLLRRSILTCDHISGIRYYGLGNEYMGMLVAMSVIGATLLWRALSNGDRKSARGRLFRIAAMIWFAVVGFVIGYPGLGANVGGLVTAVGAFGVACMMFWDVRLRIRYMIALAVLVAGIVSVFALMDALSPLGAGTHLGRALSQARIYGWEYFLLLIGDKIRMHMGILRLPQAYYPMLASIPFLILYARRVSRESPGRADAVVRAAGPSVLAGTVVAFISNDSGIVPAALIFACFTVTLLYAQLTQNCLQCE